jgi:hypothetical protein
MTNAGNLRVTILTPFYWLNSSERVYPVYIDPTTNTYYKKEIDYYPINNNLNEYYFNATNAEQRINDIQNYWAKNDVCLGLYFSNTWHEFCGDSLNWIWYNSTNFTTYMNLTGTAELNYAGYTVGAKVEYYLGKDYPEVLETVTLENTGNKDISDSYLKIKTHDIRVNLTYDNNTFRLNTTSFWEEWSGWKEYLLDQSNLDLFYTENDLSTRKYAIFDNSTESWVEMLWNNSYWKNGMINRMNYNLSVKKGSEVTAPIDLVFLTGSFNKNDVITTNFKWADAVKQNLAEVNKTYQDLVEWWRKITSSAEAEKTELHLQDWNVSIEMKPDGIVHVNSHLKSFNNNVSILLSFQIIAWKFGCFGFIKPGEWNTMRCAENKTTIQDIYKEFAEEELKMTTGSAENFSYIVPISVNNINGYLISYQFNTTPSEIEIFKKGRVKLPFIFDVKEYEQVQDFDFNFSYTGTSNCIDIGLPRFTNTTLNVTMLSSISNYTLPQEIVIENYTTGNSLIARIRVWPYNGLSKPLLNANICS